MFHFFGYIASYTMNMSSSSSELEWTSLKTLHSTVLSVWGLAGKKHTFIVPKSFALHWNVFNLDKTSRSWLNSLWSNESMRHEWIPIEKKRINRWLLENRTLHVCESGHQMKFNRLPVTIVHMYFFHLMYASFLFGTIGSLIIRCLCLP